jgi:DNA-binding NtrC family response regulator
MPRLNGVDLAKRIRYKLQSLPIVLMTGDPELATVDAINEAGAISLLIKPFMAGELVKIIRTAFDDRQL